MEIVNASQVAHCPTCGSTQIQLINVKTGGGFSAPDGVCGGILGVICLGPIGLLCVLCGLRDESSEIARMCLNCGTRF